MSKYVDSSKLCDENGCADNQAWEEYREMLGKAQSNIEAAANVDKFYGDTRGTYADTKYTYHGPDNNGYPVFTTGYPDNNPKTATEQELREMRPLFDYLFGYFPDAFLAEVEVSWHGNNQHNPGTKMHWARGKSTDHMNKAFRHIWDHARGDKRDTDGTWHLAKAIWRLKAKLQEEIEAENNNKSKEDGPKQV